MSQKGGLEYNLQENNALFHVVSLIFRTMFSVYKVFGKYHLNEEVAEVIDLPLGGAENNLICQKAVP